MTFPIAICKLARYQIFFLTLFIVGTSYPLVARFLYFMSLCILVIVPSLRIVAENFYPFTVPIEMGDRLVAFLLDFQKTGRKRR
ncbi:hypothetical protein D478_01287 [Brevibacillus agri BAB-2500]|nr:hypothetical protein D478_01287 [Brevibacillus agri BAB-2500]